LQPIAGLAPFHPPAASASLGQLHRHGVILGPQRSCLAVDNIFYLHYTKHHIQFTSIPSTHYEYILLLIKEFND
jgi:hypothetical protein